jgi:hypothetical protein
MQHLPCLQQRQRTTPRGIVSWCDRVHAALVRHLRGSAMGARSTKQGTRMGGAEIEAIHANLARSLRKLRRLFGGALAASYKEATMYPELRETPLNMHELHAFLIGD